ncbi:peptidoglycan-binding domain-containing protein, partial [Aestuariivirga sp.]|uniref:peptidoglycan-binding domain-containing protein n=1 Tax=Aestuariivirga sp. TaxID=2650926 RepID=UPI00391A0C42
PDERKRRKARVAVWAPRPSAEAANVVAITDPSWQPAAETAAPSPLLPDPGEALPSASAGAENPLTEAQKLLTRLGFNVGTVDGQMSRRTANAIKLFQLQSGLKVTGELTPELLAALRVKAG